MQSIIPIITTPLALAALGLFLGTSIVRLILRNKVSVIGKTTVQYGFWLAVILSVLANLVFAYQKWLETESIITGVVRSETGDYLSYAIVDMEGKGRAITDDNGNFLMSIPRSRMEDNYELDVSLRGYEMKTVTVDSGQRSVRVTLSVKKLSVDEFISIDPRIAIAHFIGLPQVDIQLTMENLTDQTVSVTGFTLTISKVGERDRRTLLRQSVYLERMPYMSAFEPIDLEPNEVHRAYHVFLEPDQEVSHVDQTVKSFIASLGIGKFDLDFSLITEDMAKEQRSGMEDRWFWTPGQYELVFSCTANGKRYVATGGFELLDDGGIDAMKNIAKYYRSGFGLSFGSHLQFVRDARPAMVAQSAFVYTEGG